MKTDRAFVGGVTDGRIGCGAMELNRDGMTAKKAWFFAGNTVVCLGAGISSGGEKPIATTINQCLHHGTIMVSSFGKEAVVAGPDQTLPATEWIEHDGLRYTFPNPVDVKESAQLRTGNWNHVYDNPGTPRADVTKDIFTLQLDQGTSLYCITSYDMFTAR